MTKTNTLPLGKQICFLRQCIVFVIVFSIQELTASCRMGCAEILPEMKLFTFQCVNTEASADCNDYSKTSLNSFFSF